MKRLISVKDIKDLAAKNQKVIFLEKGDIITPSAKDSAIELGVKIEYSSCTERKKEGTDSVMACEKSISGGDADFDMIYRVVREILAASGQLNVETPAEVGFVKERDSSGLLLVKGDSITFDPFDTGNPKEKVGMRDIVNIRESNNMGAGFMSIDHCDFAWNLTYEEFDYIVDGHLDITINGKTYKGKKGDVFFIPKDSNIVWHAPDFCKIFYVTYPANWAELAANK